MRSSDPNSVVSEISTEEESSPSQDTPSLYSDLTVSNIAPTEDNNNFFVVLEVPSDDVNVEVERETLSLNKTWTI